MGKKKAYPSRMRGRGVEVAYGNFFISIDGGTLMIETIKMKNCATYTTDDSAIEDCQKINFFYGANGSGKSTISKFLQNQSNEEYSDCEIKWSDNTPMNIVVYNREFREQNFKENIDGVFTLGNATIKDIEALDELKKERDRKKQEYDSRKESLEKKKIEEQEKHDQFKEKLWVTILKQNENDFQEAFSGYRGNKEKFREQVLLRYKQEHASHDTRESLKLRAATLLSSKPEKCFPISNLDDNLISDVLKIENNDIWNKVIIGNQDVPIAKMISILDNADWVSQGRKYIKNRDICPFCQQHTITDCLLKELESFFSGEYEKDIQTVKNQTDLYKKLTQELYEVLKKINTSSESITIGKLDFDKYKLLLDTLNTIFSGNISEMMSKENEASKKIQISDSSSLIKDICNIIVEANKAINDHNDMVENYNAERKKIVDDIWNFLIAENKSVIQAYIDELTNIEKAKQGIQKCITEYESNLDIIENKIIKDGANITSVEPAVREINRSLKRYGFTNFEIVPSEIQKNSYQIKRKDGTLACHTLSEGEETFISFLYFLQFAKGAKNIENVSSPKILVLDDPICSLDSTVLYIVSSLVKGLMIDVRNDKSDVKQLFILTHNVFFHKETSFTNNRSDTCNDINYWIINKDNNISRIIPYKKTNPIKTSYELLWQELKFNTNASLVTTQNIMRRILENYFSMLGKCKDNKIIESFTSIEDQMICRSLLSWINDGSHSIPDDLYIDSYTDSIDRYKHIFKDIFIQMGHKAHYDMMMGIPEDTETTESEIIAK